MSSVDEIAADLQRTASGAVVSGAAALGGAAALAFGQAASAAFAEHAVSEAETYAGKFVTVFAENLAGRIAQTVDANGITVGSAQIDTQLVAFASGKAASPIASVTVEHDFSFALGSVAAVDVAATVTLTAQYVFAAKDASPKTTTTTKVELSLTWQSG
jgi:hypothetical protein